MLSDGLTSLQADGKARDEVEVLDVAQLLLAVASDATPPVTPTSDASPQPADRCRSSALTVTRDRLRSTSVAVTAVVTTHHGASARLEIDAS